MPAADDEANTGENIASCRQSARVDMAGNVIDSDQRHFEGDREHLRGTNADEQCSDEAGRVVNRDAADVVQRNIGLLQRLVDNRQQVSQVSASGDLRHDAVKPGVQLVLRGDDVR